MIRDNFEGFRDWEDAAPHEVPHPEKLTDEQLMHLMVAHSWSPNPHGGYPPAVCWTKSLLVIATEQPYDIPNLAFYRAANLRTEYARAFHEAAENAAAGHDSYEYFMEAFEPTELTYEEIKELP